MSTLARELYEDGLREGREQELIQVALKLMKRGFPLDDVVEITGLSVERLKDLGAG